jgi:hypothetical protein
MGFFLSLSLRRYLVPLISMASQLVELALHIWFFAAGFLLAACVVSHTTRYLRANTEQRWVDTQARWLYSTARVRQLVEHAREVGIKYTSPEDLAYQVALYQYHNRCW